MTIQATLRSGAAALLMGLGAATLPASAQTADDGQPDRLNETYRDWIVQCVSQAQNGGARVCEMVQQLSQREGGQRVLTAAVRSPGNGTTQMTLIAPFGLLLSEGVSVRLGDQEVLRGTFLTCLSNGCIANLDVPADAVSALARATAATVRMTSVQGAPFEIEVSLMGFTAALNRLRGLN